MIIKVIKMKLNQKEHRRIKDKGNKEDIYSI